MNERFWNVFRGISRLNHHRFERCAAALSRLLLPDTAAIELTMPSRDGGRDAIGQLYIGNGASAMLVDFGFEAVKAQPFALSRTETTAVDQVCMRWDGQRAE